jgi:hypothetical protein
VLVVGFVASQLYPIYSRLHFKPAAQMHLCTYQCILTTTFPKSRLIIKVDRIIVRLWHVQCPLARCIPTFDQPEDLIIQWKRFGVPDCSFGMSLRLGISDACNARCAYISYLNVCGPNIIGCHHHLVLIIPAEAREPSKSLNNKKLRFQL